MDVIKRMAREFGYNIENFGFTLERIDNKLNSKLSYINNVNEKLRFLSYLRDITETKYQEHAPVCHNPETCGTNQGLENILYAIKQQYENYFEIAGGTNLSERPAMIFFVKVNILMRLQLLKK